MLFDMLMLTILSVSQTGGSTKHKNHWMFHTICLADCPRNTLDVVYTYPRHQSSLILLLSHMCDRPIHIIEHMEPWKLYDLQKGLIDQVVNPCLIVMNVYRIRTDSYSNNSTLVETQLITV